MYDNQVVVLNETTTWFRSILRKTLVYEGRNESLKIEIKGFASRWKKRM